MRYAQMHPSALEETVRPFWHSLFAAALVFLIPFSDIDQEIRHKVSASVGGGA